MIAHPFTHATHVTPAYGDAVRASAGAGLKRRVQQAIQHYGLTREAVSTWKGPVERRDPVSYRARSQHLTWLCRGAFCRRFAMHGSYKTGICNFCGTPRPEEP